MSFFHSRKEETKCWLLLISILLKHTNHKLILQFGSSLGDLSTYHFIKAGPFQNKKCKPSVSSVYWELPARCSLVVKQQTWDGPWDRIFRAYSPKVWVQSVLPWWGFMLSKKVYIENCFRWFFIVSCSYKNTRIGKNMSMGIIWITT